MFIVVQLLHISPLLVCISLMSVQAFLSSLSQQGLTAVVLQGVVFQGEALQGVVLQVAVVHQGVVL
jgi:hypothetical protein